MPECRLCKINKGFNKFHSDQRKQVQPLCKDCFRVYIIEKAASWNSSKPSAFEDFELLHLIGQGAFGKVLLVRHRYTKKIHAMKILSKKFLVEKENVDGTRSERDIMTKIRHPFIVSCTYAFQNEAKVYLVMEYQAGGELFSYLKKERTFSEDKARFYLAEMVVALEHLHARGILHRDLKPENVLISAEGHVKLTDFGLARNFKEGDALKTMCGTQEYMAPEMILGKGYDTGVDWWSLGALAYEMMIGNPPFQSNNDKDLDNKILNAKVQLPRWLSSEAHSLLKGLLERNVHKRLGSAALGAGIAKYSATRGIHTIKNHPFFKKIDWDALENLQIQPPILPVINNETDISHFDEKLTKLTPCDMDCEAPLTQDELFMGFSFYGEEELLGPGQQAVPSKPAAPTQPVAPAGDTASLPPAPPVSIRPVTTTSKPQQPVKVTTLAPRSITVEPAVKQTTLTQVLKISNNQPRVNSKQQKKPHKSHPQPHDPQVQEKKEKKAHHRPESPLTSSSDRINYRLFQITKSIALVFK